jgi:hypothetical protein
MPRFCRSFTYLLGAISVAFDTGSISVASGTLRHSPRRTILVANERRADIVRDEREMARSRMTRSGHDSALSASRRKTSYPTTARGFRQTARTTPSAGRSNKKW